MSRRPADVGTSKLTLKKHNGEGAPVNLELTDNALLATQFTTNKSLSTSKSLRTDNFLTSQFRRTGDFHSLKRSFDFVDEFYELALKFSTIKNFINQNSKTSLPLLPWSLPVGSPFASIYPKTDYINPSSFRRGQTSLIDNIAAFRGYICKVCLADYINPVFWFYGTRKLVEADHLCQEKVSLDRNFLDYIAERYWKLLLKLRNAVEFWTNNKPILISEPVPRPQNGAYLNISDSTSSCWLSRAVYEVETPLDDKELLQFLLCSGMQTYNCFSINGEGSDSYEGYYLLNISKSTR